MITSQMVINSSQFMEIALPEAFEKVADINNTSVKSIQKAYREGNMTVRVNVDSLIIASAEETAKRMNKKY